MDQNHAINFPLNPFLGFVRLKDDFSVTIHLHSVWGKKGFLVVFFRTKLIYC